MNRLPEPRGPLGEPLVEALRGPPAPLDAADLRPPADPLADEDLQLALYALYELHYRGFDGVDEGWEWHPALLERRALLERWFEEALEDAVPRRPADPDGVEDELRALAAPGEGPSLARFLELEGSLEHYREFLAHRSAYQLKEADPHSWALPRLAGRPKEALAEVQADEYGGGRPGRMHATLFAHSMRELGLDDRYGAYLEHTPGTTLATVNVMSLFGLHRRLRGALVGQLAVFEIGSPGPNRRYAEGLRRLGAGPPATLFFDEHVEADSVHEAVAAHDLAGGLARAEPALAGDIVWGARAYLHLEERFSRELLGAWAAGRSSLRRPLPAPLYAT